jgi:LysM repeat protein
MLWESTYAQNNVVCGKDYMTWSKEIVSAVTSGKDINTDISGCTSSTPSPIQPGVISTCNKYAKTNSGGAKCSVFAGRIGVSEAQLYAWNSVLGPNGENCGSKFVGDTYYCVGVTPPPGSTQAGITPYCTKYEKANAGGSCPVFANRVGISTANLYAWNTVLGDNGQNCGSSFWGDTFYCVGVSPNYVAPPKPSPTGAAPAPGPTQSGIISTCNKYLMANAGGSCSAFASRAGISTSQLYAWNKVLGNNGQNCASSFWGNTYYCVGVRSSKIKRNAAAEITGSALPAYGASSYGGPSDAYPVEGTLPAAEPTQYSKTTSSSELLVSTPEPYISASEPVEISSTYPAVPSSYSTPAALNSSSIVIPSASHYETATTYSSRLLANATLSSITTAYMAPAYPTSAGTGHASSNTTATATGSAFKPTFTTSKIHEYTGAGSRTDFTVGLAALIVGTGLFLM